MATPGATTPAAWTREAVPGPNVRATAAAWASTTGRTRPGKRRGEGACVVVSG